MDKIKTKIDQQDNNNLKTNIPLFIIGVLSSIKKNNYITETLKQKIEEILNKKKIC